MRRSRTERCCVSLPTVARTSPFLVACWLLLILLLLPPPLLCRAYEYADSDEMNSGVSKTVSSSNVSSLKAVGCFYIM